MRLPSVYSSQNTCARRSARIKGLLTTALLATLLGGCEQLNRKELGVSAGPAFDKNAETKEGFYTPLRPPQHDAENQQYTVEKKTYATEYTTTPHVTPVETVANATTDDIGADLKGPSISVNYNNIPLPNFINEVFGEQLGLSFTLQPDIHKQQDLVTLHITEAVSPAELFRIARTTLSAYGVVINKEGGVLVFVIDKTSKGGQTPLLVSGRTLPDVPDSQRPIFMFVPLQVVSNAKVKGWLSSVMTGVELEIQEDPIRNAIVLVGKSQYVEQALAIIKSLDQPLMRGKFTMSVQPAYIPVKQLANDLERVLQSEGFDASQRTTSGSVIVLPLESSNSLVVFAPNQQTLDHVRQWVNTMDRERQLGIDDGIFSYQVNSTKAENIVDVLNQLYGGAGSAKTTHLNVQPSDATALNQPTTPAGTAVNANADYARGRFVLDPNRNAVIFRGSGQEWLDLLPTIRAMDKPAPSVLVEVLIAEVTLNDQEASGVEWLGNSSIDIGNGTYNVDYGTLLGLGIGSSGFNLTLDNAGETRAVLNLFYENKRAEIRSRPRLMVMSGQSARIDVGDEIPVISSSSQSIQDPTNSLVTSNVEYRKTGIKLEIKPTVHASGYVDVEINQELSQAQKTTTSAIDSPTIFNRSIQTTVSLKDGGSILLGGLVSTRGGSQQRGVPLLGKLPLVGKFFRTDADTGDRTDLMVLVIPYVVRSPEEATELSKMLAPID